MTKPNWISTMHTDKPFGSSCTSVYVPGEPLLPPGISHEIAFELAYQKHLNVQQIESTSTGLLKCDDQFHHSPTSPHLISSYTQTGSPEMNPSLILSRRRGKRHFDPKESYVMDHLQNTLTGISPLL